MASTRMREIDWDSLLMDQTRFGEATRRVKLLSLSAVAVEGYQKGESLIVQAIQDDPFQPIHRVRLALHFARFGDFKSALYELEQIREAIPDLAEIGYLHALLNLRCGLVDRAKSQSSSLVQRHPNFVPARFLSAEAKFLGSEKLSSFEADARALPVDPRWDGLWTDLFVKVALLAPKGGTDLVQKNLTTKISDPVARTRVKEVLAWLTEPLDALSEKFVSVGSDSVSESLLLIVLADRLNREASCEEAIRRLEHLSKRHPDRTMVRTLTADFLNRRAAELARDRRFEAALRLVECSQTYRPHDPVGYLNRAAIFTGQRSRDSYFEAWLSLHRHLYRLLILGVRDESTITQAASVHRLFAQQAVGGANEKGLLRSRRRSETSTVIEVDDDEIAADLDLLRSWIHHTLAETVIRHYALGDDPEQALLFPDDRYDAMNRAEALARATQSLAVLVPEEGAMLGEMLSKRWASIAACSSTLYAPAQPPNQELERLHLNTTATLLLLCKQWDLEPEALVTAEDVLAMVQIEREFFREDALYRALGKNAHERPFQLQALGAFVEEVTGVADGPLTHEQRKSVFDHMEASLLRSMSFPAYDRTASNAGERVEHSLSCLERARERVSNDPDLELVTARFFVLGEFYTDARRALDRFYRVAEPDDTESRLIADEIEEILRKNRDSGERIAPRTPGKDDPFKSRAVVERLEGELDRSPSSLQAYREIVRELALVDRYDEAVAWTDRAMTHCLGRSAQMSARTLAIEAHGLRILGQTNPGASKLYMVGSHDPARRAIADLPEESRNDANVLYLQGQCDLALGDIEAARLAFQAAARASEIPRFRVALRTLADDIDLAYLATAREQVNEALAEGQSSQAVSLAISVLGRLQRPEVWLIELARVLLTILPDCLLGGRIIVSDISLPSVKAPWVENLRLALVLEDPAAAFTRLTDLVETYHPESARFVPPLRERALAIRHESVVRSALKTTNDLLMARRFHEMIASLDALDPEVASVPRMIRMKILALLSLNRFEEADQAFRTLPDDEPSTAAFRSEYPSLALRQRLRFAHIALNEGNADQALARLDGASPADEQDLVEFAYVRGFALALRGYKKMQQKEMRSASTDFVEALEVLESQLGIARKRGMAEYVQLIDRVEAEVSARG